MFCRSEKKTPLNRARLRKQIARCNSLANKDKATYFRALVKENGDDPKKLWQVLRSALHHIPDKVLPSNSSQKQLADQFATFFTNKIAKIRESFSSSSSFSLPSPVNPPGLVKFDVASPDDIAKVIKNSPTKSCLLDPWPTFLVKDCLDILLPSITKLVNCSLSEGAVPDGFKSTVVTPLIKNLCKLCFIQMRDLRQIRQYLTRDAALMAANALVGSRLDYCNSLFRGLSVANLRKLQCIQNSLARTVCREPHVFLTPLH